MKDIHIVIYSLLHAGGGGRETWLDMFLPELYKQTAGKIDIFVYYVERNKCDNLINSVSDPRFHFIKALISSCFIADIFTLMRYTFRVSFLLRKNVSDNSFVLCVGSFYELFPVWIIRKFVRRKNRFKYIVWLRTIWAKQMKALRNGKIARIVLGFERKNLKKADLIIANGWDTAAYYEKMNLKSVVIPNAIRIRDYQKVEKLQTLSHPVVIAYIGRLSQEKGLKNYLQSILFFNSSYPLLKKEIRFEVVGDGPLKDDVLNFKSENFIYRGSIPNKNMISYINTIHAGVALTYSDGELGGGAGVSNQLLELVAAKRLIIAWNTKIFTQVLSETNAFLIPQFDVGALANVYREIIENSPNVIKKLEGLDLVCQRFSLKRHVELFIDSLYKLDDEGKTC